MVEVDACLAAEAVRVVPEPVAEAPTIKAANEAINDLPPITHPAPVVRTSKAGIDLIHMFEGYARKLPDGSAQAYPDPGTGGKPWTIGWGSTTDENGKPIKPGDIWTRQRADARFARHLAQFEAGVLHGLRGSAVTQAQFDAMVSLAYNIGVAAFQGSTLLRRHRAGDYAAAEAEFHRWNRAGGRVMKGLVRRRAAEARMYGGD
jgi:GH24 family phage-related lysozyme (muramidase)